MFNKFRTYFLLLIPVLSVLWHGCKDPSPIVFTMDIVNQIGPFSNVSTPSRRVAITAIDSSGWEIISNDTSYTAMALLSTIRYDSATTHHRIVLSKILIQDRTQPVLSADQTQIVGYLGERLLQAYADDALMHLEKRHVTTGLSDSALGYQYSAVNIDDQGPDNHLSYPAGGLFNWKIQLLDNNPVYIGGIPPQEISVVSPSPDSVEILEINKNYVVKWVGPNASVDLVISEYGGGIVNPKKHINFQHAQSNSAKIDIGTFYPGPYLFTFSTTTEVTSDISGIPITMRFASIHNVVVRMK
jgi:hypothetical protein